ncbi:uncharacterized protein VNE69_01090 [Vairimorpha necatrix]|uniref:Uncharacterized protein n=1 Tax=Vairimorpha necatrix TaxID=6039 RepID=A0AAX4J894_9MICR
MLEKLLKSRDIDKLLDFLIKSEDLDYNDELVDLLSNFYNKEKDISNIVLYLNTLKNEKSKKKKSKESGYFLYNYTI